jgi:hypothetical protein
MAVTEGVTEIPDSEEEPFTSSPQENTYGPVPNVSQDAQSLHQASAKKASHAAPNGIESLSVDRQHQSQSANLYPNLLLQQEGDAGSRPICADTFASPSNSAHEDGEMNLANNEKAESPMAAIHPHASNLAFHQNILPSQAKQHNPSDDECSSYDQSHSRKVFHPI